MTSKPKAILFPMIFLIVVAPVALFVVSGAGTHMSPLLLYPFAFPWWILFFRGDVPVTEVSGLLIGCGLNAILLTVAGLLLDRRRRS